MGWFRTPLTGGRKYANSCLCSEPGRKRYCRPLAIPRRYCIKRRRRYEYINRIDSLYSMRVSFTAAFPAGHCSLRNEYVTSARLLRSPNVEVSISLTNENDYCSEQSRAYIIVIKNAKHPRFYAPSLVNITFDIIVTAMRILFASIQMFYFGIFDIQMMFTRHLNK